MGKPPLRTKSIGFKVSEEEYAQLETAAQADGRTLGEWCREVILRGGSASDAERHDPALAEIVGVRLLLVNVLRPLAAGGPPSANNCSPKPVKLLGWPAPCVLCKGRVLPPLTLPVFLAASSSRRCHSPGLSLSAHASNLENCSKAIAPVPLPIRAS